MLETIVFVLLRLRKLFPRCHRMAARRISDGVSDRTIRRRGEIERKKTKAKSSSDMAGKCLASPRLASPHFIF